MVNGNRGLKILLILLIGGIGVQTIYAKKEKDTATKDTVAVVVKKETKIIAKDTIVKAVEKEETVIKVDGILEVGFDNNYKANKETTEYKKIGRAEVGISLRPTKKVRAEMGFEYNRNDSIEIETRRTEVDYDSRSEKVTDVRTIIEKHKIERLFIMDKLYLQYNPLNFSTIRFGYMKKSFGLEEKAGLDERYFRKRSIINDSLEGFGFLDHDLTLQYRHEFSKKLELRGGFSWTKDSTQYLQNYSVEYDDKKNNLILAAIIRHYFPSGKKSSTAYVSSLSFRRENSLFASEAELTYGVNPYIKTNYDRNATIFGARVKEKFSINTGLTALQQIIPVAEAAYYSGDFDESDDFDTQLRAGLTLGFAKKSAFQWRNNYGVVSKVRDDKKELWRKRYDSEVVVVF